eukprot:GDKH01000721.1.p1 GENE.GDKH01000721.1~~GDKH01000721.1.p1  ORF type:complete len:264 (-),score=34.57 GDKH01000721.1:125-916(-)
MDQQTKKWFRQAGFLALWYIWLAITLLLLWLQSHDVSVVATLGVRPREMGGLPGVFLAPLLYGHWFNLMIEGCALFACPLFFFDLDLEDKTMLELTRFIVIFSGVAVWLLGAERVHSGAGGLAFGYAAFFSADLGRQWSNLRASDRFCLAFQLVNMAFSFLNETVTLHYLHFGEDKSEELERKQRIRAGISWELRGFGFLAGHLFAAFFYKPRLVRQWVNNVRPAPAAPLANVPAASVIGVQQGNETASGDRPNLASTGSSGV